jgi:hypothetical protein
VVSIRGADAGAELFRHVTDLGPEVFKKYCFAAGTPLLTPEGSKPVEQFKPGDLVLSRDEWDPSGPAEPKRVEEVFTATAAVVDLHAGGQVIRTTAEHLFWVRGRGWTAVADFEPGYELVGHDGQRTRIDRVSEVGGVVAVYNMRIADHHTYFVGDPEWGFSLWAHNNYGEFKAAAKNSDPARFKGKTEEEIDAILLPIYKGYTAPCEADRASRGETARALKGLGVKKQDIDTAISKAEPARVAAINAENLPLERDVQGGKHAPDSSEAAIKSRVKKGKERGDETVYAAEGKWETAEAARDAASQFDPAYANAEDAHSVPIHENEEGKGGVEYRPVMEGDECVDVSGPHKVDRAFTQRQTIDEQTGETRIHTYPIGPDHELYNTGPGAPGGGTPPPPPPPPPAPSGP